MKKLNLSGNTFKNQPNPPRPTIRFQEAEWTVCRRFTGLTYPTLYQEQAVFGKMKMDPAKRAQTQNAG
jgi:hypothetical protein